MKYLSRNNTNAHVQQASVVWDMRTWCQSLFLGDELKACLDLDALRTQEATHVLWRIDWGAYTTATVKKTTTHVDGEHELSMQLGGGPRGPASNSSDNKEVAITATQNKTLLRRVVESIGKAYGGGGIESDGSFRTAATSFEFQIVTSMPVDAIPTDYDGVMDFARRALYLTTI